MKQTSDHMNKNKTAGTGITSLSTKDTSIPGNVKPAATNPSGSSQSHSRGKQGHG